MELGKKIKQLRLNKGITQEALANVLGVTYQAVSRWENEMTMPDITLLPEISVFFGVSIDELFEFTEESQYQRIKNMLNEKSMLLNTEFENAKCFLEKQLTMNSNNIDAIKLLAELYMHQSNTFNIVAAEYATKALMLGDTSKSMNNILRDVSRVPHTDWNFRNHHELINFYIGYIKEYPNELQPYRYLLPMLIADGRVEEARHYLDQIKEKEELERLFVYEVMILRRVGKIKEANQVLDNMTKQFSTSWYAWVAVADFRADDCKYEEAIVCYEKSIDLQESPKYTDSLEAIAHIYEIQHNYKKAIETYNRIIELLRVDWNVTFGTTINKYLEKINELTRNDK